MVAPVRALRSAVIVFVGLAGLSLAGCGGGSGGYGGSPTTPTAATPTPSSNAVTVNINGVDGNMSFSPNPVVIKAGQQVIWHNMDAVPHRVIADSAPSSGHYSVGAASAGAFDTGEVAPGSSSAAMTFGTVATIPYHCGIHPSMVGSITVN